MVFVERYQRQLCFHTLLLLKMRGPRAPSTNAPPVYLDMELSAKKGRLFASRHTREIPASRMCPKT